MKTINTAASALFAGLLLLSACSDGGGGEPPPTAPENRIVWTDVAAGTHHTCAIDSENVAYCWGTGYVGQLGNGSTANAYEPTPVSGGLRFRSIAAGVDHTCAVTTAGQVYCWGTNTTSQLGGFAGPTSPDPVQVLGMTGIRRLVLGVAGSYAQGEDGRLFCWGFACLGSGKPWPNPEEISTPIHVSLLPPLAGFASGGSHQCGATTERRLVCWGEGLYRSLGAVPEQWDPVRDYTVVLPDLAFSGGAAAYGHSCGLTTAGAVHCWGDNAHGQLGLGVQDPPVDVWTGRAPGPAATGGIVFAQVFAGGLITCGLTADGTAYCWGNNSSGQLGDGTLTARAAPTAVAGGHRFSKLTIGGYRDATNGRFVQHVCGITTAGRLYCWGGGDFGAAGNRAPINAHTPVAVDDPA